MLSLPRDGTLRRVLDGEWSAMVFLHFLQKPLHDRTVPSSLRPRRTVEIAVPDGNGGAVLKRVVKRVTPEVPPSGATVTVVLSHAELTDAGAVVVEDFVFHGDSFLHPNDQRIWSKEKGYRYALRRVLSAINRSPYQIPAAVKAQLSLWLCDLPTDEAYPVVEKARQFDQEAQQIGREEARARVKAMKARTRAESAARRRGQHHPVSAESDIDYVGARQTQHGRSADIVG